MITADQLVAHAIGDYLLQSDWMATEKIKRNLAALVHAMVYGLPFLWLVPSPTAWIVIVVSHAVIDRWRLARYVVWTKNLIRPGLGRETLATLAADWRRCSLSGYPPEKPAWLAGWLLIIADNTLHVLCNAAAIRWLA